MSIVPWAALNLLALPAVIAKVSWQRVSSAVASRAAFSGGGQELSESLVSRIGAVGDGGVASAWAIDLAVVVVVGVVVSLIAEAVVSARPIARAWPLAGARRGSSREASSPR